AETLYFFEFPSWVKLELTVGGSIAYSCSSFCGYHYHTLINGKPTPFAVIPDMAQGQCHQTCITQPSNYMNDVTSVHSHELMEAITDAEVTIGGGTYVPPSAWGDLTCGEDGDMCSYQEDVVNLNGTSWTVQQTWSNSAHDCVSNGT